MPIGDVDKSWTFEQVWAAQEEWRRDNPEARLGAGPFFQWDAMHHLDVLKRAFNKGDSFSLLHAIYFCAFSDLVMPDWVAREFLRSFREVLHCKVKSWDEAFGRPYPKGFHIKEARLRRLARPLVWSRVREIRLKKPETRIDEALFEKVGKECGFGKTVASELYYEQLHWFEKMDD